MQLPRNPDTPNGLSNLSRSSERDKPHPGGLEAHDGRVRDPTPAGGRETTEQAMGGEPPDRGQQPGEKFVHSVNT